MVAGNEPFFAGDGGDARSLSLPAGASATSPGVCIGVEHPTVRFFARNTGPATSTLGVSAVFRFTALDDRGEWTIGDVYVAPYKKG